MSTDDRWAPVPRPTEEELAEGAEEDEEDAQDDDPRCVCGVYRSEHALMGCPEGFQTPNQWATERAFIRSLDDDEYERIYGED